MIDGGGQATGSGLVLPGFTFGEDLDVLVETFASPDIDSVRSSLPTIEVIATVQPHPGAEIIQVSQDRKSSLSTAYREGTGQFEIPLNEVNEQAISTLQRVFYGAAFEALASIWNGTKAAPRQRVLPASGQDASKHETTTSSGRGAAA
jgi:hypothetical protein